MNLKISYIGSNYLDAVNRLIFQETKQYQDSRPDISIASENFFDKDTFNQLFLTENCFMFGCFDTDTLTGILVATKNETKGVIKLPRKIAYIEQIIVDEAYRQQGIGKMLYETLKTHDFVKDCDAIELNVHADNEAAIAFYEKLGFTASTIRYEAKVDQNKQLQAVDKTIKVSKLQ